jgi:anti-sigma B factor antagonist
MGSFYIGDGAISNDVAIVIVGGEIDYEASPRLKARIMEHLNGDGHRLVLDFSWVTFIDSTAIGVLMGAVAKLRETGGDPLAIVCTHERVLQICEISGLESMVTLYRSCDEALAPRTMTG